LVGGAIKVTPVLEKDAESVNSTFPNGTWVNLDKYSDIVAVDEEAGAAFKTI